MNKEKKLYYFVVVLFIFSGLASLIYQITWFKQLSYFLGSSTYSQSVVLATFMGGIAIGSWYWGKKADISKNPLRIFAFLEIGIAIYCFFYKQIFSWVEEIFTSIILNAQLESDDTKVLLLKIIASGFSIIIPAILMGGTLPILVRFTSKKITDVGKNVTLLYLLNSLGAVLGTVFGGFYLVEKIGLTGSIYTAATLEIIIGFICLTLSRSSKLNLIDKSKKEYDIIIKETTANHNPLEVKTFSFLILVAAFSGFCSMLYEIVWLRLLVPILGSSTFSFTVILAVFVSGITIGSLIVYLILPKIKNSLRVIGLSQLGIVIAIFLTLPFYERVPYTLWSILSDNSKGINDYSFYVFLQFIFSSVVIILPTISMGITLPLINTLAITSINESGRKVGLIFSINTVGTVLGSLITGLILIPFIGIKSTLYLGMTLNFLIGFFILLKSFKKHIKSNIAWLSFLIISVLFFLLNEGTTNWVNAIMTSDVPRKINRVKATDDFEEFLTYNKEFEKILFYEEGLTGTIVVAKSQNEVYLYTNGKGDANSVGDLPTQVSLAQVPMILHPNAESVFVIGFGAGTTIGNVLTHKSVKYAAVAEISPEVINASKYFEHVNKKPLIDNRLQVIKDDGVAALRLSSKKYDLIISQPSNPWSAGVGNLFTVEFFRDCKKKLNPGGIVAQWFSLYEMDDKSLKLIIRTVLKEFENIELWQIGTNDILMLCSEKALNLDMETLKKNYNSVSPILNEIDVRTFPVFLSQQFCRDIELIKKYAGSGPVNTEDFPLLEHWAPKAYFYNSKPIDFFKIDERNNFPLNANLLLSKYQNNFHFTEKDINELALYHYFYSNQRMAKYFAAKNPEIILTWAKYENNKKNTVEALRLLDWGKTLKPANMYFPTLKATILDSLGSSDLAINEFNDFLNKYPLNKELYYERGYIYLKVNKINEAKKDFMKSIDINPLKIEAYNNLSTILAKEGKHYEAIEILNSALLIEPNNSQLLFNRGITYGFLNEYSKCIDDLSIVIELDKSNSQTLFLRGKCYYQLKKFDKACIDWGKSSLLGNIKAKEELMKFCK